MIFYSTYYYLVLEQSYVFLQEVTDIHNQLTLEQNTP